MLTYMTKENLATVLRNARKALGLTQADVARGAKISLTYLRNLESGIQTKPSYGVMRRISNVLKLRPEDVPDPEEGYGVLDIASSEAGTDELTEEELESVVRGRMEPTLARLFMELYVSASAEKQAELRAAFRKQAENPPMELHPVDAPNQANRAAGD